MADMNFIPSHRMAARDRRARIRRWATASVVWAMVLVTLYAGAYALWGGGRKAMAGEQRRVAARILETSQAIRMIQHELASQNLLLRSGQIVENQPDWSILLAVLPRTLSGDVVLKRCELRADPTFTPPPVASPAAAPAAAPAPARPGSAQPAQESRPAGPADEATAAARDATSSAEVQTPFLLKVAGYGKTMPAVLQFVQELERTGLFDHVRLVQTSPEVVQSTVVSAFLVECTLGGKDAK
jgi:hypothetical protein